MRTLITLVLAGALAFGTAQAQEEVSDRVLSLDSLLSTRISSAAKYEQTTREAAASITVVTRDDIESYGYRTISDVLAGVPGFYLTDDRSFLTVGARGFGRPADFNNRVLLLVDGNTVNDNFFGAASVGPALALNLDAVDRVEVVRGPGSALYGTGAVFAVINVVTRPGKAVDGALVATSAGSFGHRGVQATAGAARGEVDVMVSGLWEDSDGQWLQYPEFPEAGIGDGVADHQDWARRGGFLATAAVGDFRLLGRVATQKAGVAAVPYPDEHAYTRGTNSGAELRYERSLGARHEVMVRTYLHWYGGFAFFPIDAVTGWETDVASRARGAELAWRWDPASYTRLVVGAEYTDRYRAETVSRVTGFDDVTLSAPGSVFSLYAQEQLNIGRHVTLLGGIRGDFYSNGRSPVSPRAAVVANPRPSTTLKLLYGEALRVPTPMEDQVSLALPGVARLDPERVRTAELVWEERLTPWLQSSLSGFVYDASDFIDTRVDSTWFFAYYANVGEVNTKGAELALQARLGRRIHGYGSVELAFAEDERSGERLTNSPPYLVKMGVSRHMLGVDLSAEVRHEGERTTYLGGTTAPFTLANLTLSHRAHRVGRLSEAPLARAEFAVQLRNVFDASYRLPAPTGYLQEAFVQNGRTLMVTVGYRF